MFINDRRDDFRSKNPNVKFTEVTKLLSAEWRELSDKDK